MGASEAQPDARGVRLQAADVERLYREMGPRLHQFIRRQVAEPALAADLLQDVFVRVMRSNVEQRSDGEMRSYLYRTATSLITDFYRTARVRRTVPFVAELEEHEPQLQMRDDAVNAQALRSQLDRGFAQLAAKDRTLLWLAYVEEMNHTDIAATVGVGAASVKVMLSRARSRLATALAALGISQEELS